MPSDSDTYGDGAEGNFFKGLLWALVLSIPLYALIALAFWVM